MISPLDHSDTSPTADSDPKPPDFATITSLEEGCSKLGAFLNLDGPVSADVFAAAVEDPVYAKNLLICRNEPAFLRHLIAKPPVSWTGDGVAMAAPAAHQPKALSQQSTAALFAKATTSLMRWARDGFEIVGDGVYQRRLDACAACVHLGNAPGKLVYRVASALRGKSDDKICTICGCVVAIKARLAHEACPDRDFDTGGLSRWGERRAMLN